MYTLTDKSLRQVSQCVPSLSNGGLVELILTFVVLFCSKSIAPVDDAGEMTGSAVRSYFTVERPSGGKQIRKAKQHTPGKPVGSPMQTYKV